MDEQPSERESGNSRETESRNAATTLIIIVFILALLALMYGSFKLGQIYICKQSGGELLVLPKLRCVTHSEWNNMQRQYDEDMRAYNYSRQIQKRLSTPVLDFNISEMK